jgi:hypothetical protein
MSLAWLFILLSVSQAAPDTLVVCPAEFRPALASWMEHRRGQGHEILVINPPRRSADVMAAIRRVARGGRLKFVLLIGDAPSTTPGGLHPNDVFTNYTPARINTRWGSEATIATDTPYSDVDGDGIPDLALGRIAADSVDELAAALSKVVRYENAIDGHDPQRLNVVVGAGGFGKLTDALIEAAGQRVFKETVPTGYEVRSTLVSAPASSGNPRGRDSQIRTRIRDQLNEGSLAWIYLGHGLPTQIACPTTSPSEAPLLSVSDVGALRCGCRTPLAVLVACYTGAIDAPRDCLAEELSLAAEGPVAVIAATRVTMPYGNTVVGYELLRASFQESTPTIGEILMLAQRRVLHSDANDEFRKSLDAMCRGLSPPPVDLAAERGEHVLMYQLLGDPLLRLRRWRPNVAQAPTGEPGAK